MSDNQPSPKESAAKLLAYLHQLRNDRGAMADLRCAVNPARRARAWPLLARVGGIDRPIYEAVAGLYAYHPDSPGDRPTRNLGETCRLIADTSRRPDGTSTFDIRLNRLLTCDRDEIGERLRPVILAAKAKGIPVNYEELFADLCYWGDNVKARWAREYWGAPADTEEVGR